MNDYFCSIFNYTRVVKFSKLAIGNRLYNNRLFTCIMHFICPAVVQKVTQILELALQINKLKNNTACSRQVVFPLFSVEKFIENSLFF